jgi:ABC-type glycerol-3-phosphate transport system substrate-binding protein
MRTEERSMSERMFLSRLTRRSFLAGLGATAALPVLAACQPQIVEKTVEVPVVVKETVVVEKIVEKEIVVEKPVEVEKQVIVEREVVVEKLGRQEVKVRFFTTGGPNADLWKSHEALHNEISDTTRIEIEPLIAGDVEAWIPQHRIALASGSPPDFSFMFSNARWYPPLLENDLIAHLGPYAEKYDWESRFAKFLWEENQFTTQGHMVPTVNATFPFCYYNKTLYDELKLEVPENRIPTIEQLTGYVEAVRGAGKESIALGNKNKWPGSHLIAVLGHRLLDRENLRKLRWACGEDTGLKWTDPQPVKILETVADWAKKGFFAKGVNAMDNAQAEDLFIAGAAGMYSGGLFHAGNLAKKNPDFEFRAFHYPILDPSVPFVVTNLPGAGAVISSKSKFRDEIAALIDVAISKEGQKRQVEDWAQFPSTLLLKDEMNLKVIHPSYAEIVRDAATYPPEFFHPQGDCPEQFISPWITDLQLLFDGTKTGLQHAEFMQATAERLMNR